MGQLGLPTNHPVVDFIRDEPRINSAAFLNLIVTSAFLVWLSTGNRGLTPRGNLAVSILAVLVIAGTVLAFRADYRDWRKHNL